MTNNQRLALGALVGLLVSGSASVARADAGAKEALTRAQNAVMRGDFAAAAKELATVKSGPERVDALLEQARIQLETGRYAEAEKTAKTAAGLGKDAKIAAAPLRAEALARQGKTDDAIAALQEVASDDHAVRANLELGDLLIRSGKRTEADQALRRVIAAYNNDVVTDNDAEGLSLVGRAAHLLRKPKNANHAYNLAEKAGGNKRVETLLFRADLFLDKYDPGHAGEVVKEALKLAPKDPDAHVAMARVKLDSTMDFDGAESEIKQALEVNPRLAGAYAVRAGLALRDMDIAAADAAADKGLETNPSDLELLSMKAAARFLSDDPKGFDAIKAKVLKIDPEYSTFYSIVGEYAEWEHRYDDIIRMMGEATKVDPDDAKAYATLGLNLIRAGDEKAGLEALRQAWARDRYNVRVYNTLNLYDKTIATEYTTVDGQPFKIRYQNDEKPMLERYVPRMLEEAWGSMVSRYGFTPKNPVFIELYADPEHFSVRTSGLPNVGIQGVCFGQTLAAMSPGAGSFNWGNVLWHELGHVFAIQLSKNHVPRWFTEGLSEYETIVRRPEWKREEDPSLFAALQAGRIPPVEGMNRAFTHVDAVEDVTMAYYAASQILVYVVEDFGFPKVVDMLQRWGRGERTGQVVQESLGISASDLDTRFRAWVSKRLDRYRKQYVPDLYSPPLEDARRAALADPKNPRRHVELALALLQDGQVPEAQAVLAETLQLDPKQADAEYLEVKMALSQKDVASAARFLKKMIADGHDGYAVRMKAADVAEALEDWARMKDNLEAAFRFDPIQAEPLQGLYDLAHKQNDESGELSALQRLAMIDQHDRRVWKMLLEHLVKRGQWEEARKVGEGAMFIDVMNPDVHRLYARALARTGRFVSAVYELNSAIVAKPPPKDAARIYRELATAYEKLGRKDYAAKAADFAKQMDAASAQPSPDGPPSPKHDKPESPLDRPSAELEKLSPHG